MASESPVIPSIGLAMAELVRQLADFGKALLDPPASNAELLVLLEEFELFLSGISQGPEVRVISSLGPSKKALIANQLLRHADTDVQIAVLCCISEITRITAPNWPYEDNEMKEFFLLVVQALGRLSSVNDSCYSKVVSILYTIARVRSCIVMLDLQMEGSILEMFQHFLTSIQSKPSTAVFSDMVVIMTLLIGEYCKEGDVPVDLLSVLLTSVKKDNKDVSPTSWALGEQILQKSATKIGPSLAKAVRSLGLDFNDYPEIVTSICQKEAQVENMVDQELASDSARPTEIGRLVDGRSKSVENNSTAQDMDNGISSEQNSLKTLEFGNQTTQSPLADNATSERDVGPLIGENSLKEETSGAIEVQKATDLETISDAEDVSATNSVRQENNHGIKFPKKRERKPNSLFGLEEGYRFTRMTGETGHPKLSCGQKNTKRKSNGLSDRKSNVISFGNQSFLDENLCRKGTPKKKGYKVNQDYPEQKQVPLPSQMVRSKWSRGKTTIPASCDEESTRETLSHFEVLTSRSSSKPAPKSQHKRKSSSSKGDASGMTYGEKLVGCKIKVWWPMDQEYYEGSVDSFNLSTMKHKVIYDDGDEETLNLMGEDWQLVKDTMLLDGQEKVQGSSASSDPNSSVGPSSKKRKEDNNGDEIAGVATASMVLVESWKLLQLS